MVLQELRFGVRLWHRRPLPFLVAVVVLSLGIAAAAIGADMLRTLLEPRVRGSDRVGRLGAASPIGLPGVGPLPRRVARQVKEQTSAFSQIVATSSSRHSLVREDASLTPKDDALVSEVSEGALELAGVTVLKGRPFGRDAFLESQARPLLISQRLWASVFASDPSVLGQTVDISHAKYVVVGILRDGEGFPAADAWVSVPLGDKGAQSTPSTIYVRLRDGESWESSRAQLATVSARIVASNPELPKGTRLSLLPLDDEARSKSRVVGVALMGPSLLLLLVSCFTVGNLLLGVALERERETAVRLALGLSRFKFARQLLIEATLLAIPAGILSLLAIYLGERLIVKVVPPELSLLFDSLSMRSSTLATVACITVGAPLVFGLAPLLYSIPVGVGESLRQANRSASLGFRRFTARDVLILLQVAVAVGILTVFGMYRGMLWTMLHPVWGFDGDRLVAVSVTVDSPSPTAPVTVGDVLRQVRAVGGAEAVSIANRLPLPGSGGRALRPGDDRDGKSEPAHSAVMEIGPDYFDVLRVKLLRGRSVEASDTQGGGTIAVVSASLATKLWPGRDPLGRVVGGAEGEEGRRFEIVGVAPDLVYDAYGESSRNCIYLPLSLGGAAGQQGGAIALFRRTGDGTTLLRDLRRLAREAPAGFLLGSPRVFSQIAKGNVASNLFVLNTVAALGLTTLLLAAAGIAAITVELVRSNLKELGIRLAIGADPGQLVRLVLKNALTKVMLGVLLGLPGPVVYNYLYPPKSVSPNLLFSSPVGWSLATGPIALICICCYVAARRATRADPALLMRVE
jgi:putative ABC transport system permease protein